MTTPTRTRFTSIPAALTHWAEQRPDAVAYTFVDGELQVQRDVTYRELEDAAVRMAAALQRETRRGDRVLLLFAPGLDYLVAFLGCLYAGVVAVPLYLPRPGAKFDRIEAVIRSCRPTHALTNELLSGYLADLPRPAGSENLRVHTVEELSATPRALHRAVEPGAEELAFLQYTSGSTGDPKGVMVSHGNLAENEEAIADGFGVRSDDLILSWLPLYHDMGLIGAALLPLYLGLRTVMLDTFAFIHDPLIWPRAIARFGATCSGGPNFAYQLLVDRYDPERLAGLDLSRWRIAFNGAEPVVEKTLRSFADVYRGHGFDARAIYPCYGLAEATLFVSGAEPMTGHRTGQFDRTAVEQGLLRPVADPGAEDGVAVVSAGRPALRTDVVIRDAEGRAVPDGTIGEICVRSAGVAQGYWGDAAATEETFRARVAGYDGTFLRTGDLGALHGGELYPVGRRKDLLIVAGRNFYPHDIENVATSVGPHLRKGCAAAFQPDPQAPEVVLVAEVRRTSTAGLRDDIELAAAVRGDVLRAVGAECDLDLADVVFVYPGSLPKTSSGKIRRAEARARHLAGRLRLVTPAPGVREAERARVEAGALHTLGEAERGRAVRALLGELIAARLGGVPGPEDRARPLAALGLNSLQLTAVKAAFEQRIGQPVESRLFYGDRSLDEVAAALTARTATAASPGHAAPTGTGHAAPTGPGPAAEGQIQMQFYDELHPLDTANNLPTAVRLSRRYEPEVLRRAVAAVIDRHVALRTVFGPLGTGTQQVRDDLRLDWRPRDFTDGEDDAVRAFLHEAAYTRFSLTEGPLVRAAAATSADRTVLLFVCHHSVADHWSLRTVLAQILRRLPGVDLPEEPAERSAVSGTALEWAGLQAAAAAGPATGARLDRLAERWHPLRNHLLFTAGSPGVRGRNPAGVVDFEVDAATAARLAEHAKRHGRTPFVTLAAAYLWALHQVTGEQQVVIGVPHHGRTDGRFTDTVGYLVNMLPLLGDFRGGERPETLEQRTWDGLRAALEDAEVPFARLVKALAPERHGQNPVFQATLTFQQSADDRLAEGFSLASSGCRQTVGEIELQAVDVPPRDVAFAVSLYGTRHEDRLVFRLVHQERLVDAATAGRVAEAFRSGLQALLSADSPSPDGLSR
ncbi:AMP-binding protein [Streptomyces sp. NPDC002851]